MSSNTLQKIRKFRNEKNLSQEVVAEQIGCSQSLYAKLENGKVKISLTTLQKIATVLGVNISTLLD
ncbi:helix-turn-helix transcriptional regulator [Flavobacterium sp.]|uniref:helix-turn-helix domain-containing protein n=1 Tax=Flavobacterium sp. TaxID=239 RepID=UPI00261B6F5F|nr:helix-turn-helix transcriptional regulator [Flavobacterium sp.]MDD2984907.1 helix-turn-helix transcriptional regulator [Flavobacterium sp.]